MCLNIVRFSHGNKKDEQKTPDHVRCLAWNLYQLLPYIGSFVLIAVGLGFYLSHGPLGDPIVPNSASLSNNCLWNTRLPIISHQCLSIDITEGIPKQGVYIKLLLEVTFSNRFIA